MSFFILTKKELSDENFVIEANRQIKQKLKHISLRYLSRPIM